MVSHLPTFIDWPTTKTASPLGQFRICVLGPDKSAAALQLAFRNTGVLPSGLSVAVVTITSSKQIEGCQMLYMDPINHAQVTGMLPAIARAPVLTVVAGAIKASEDEIIGLPLEQGRVHIQVNLAAAQSHGITISSKLLSISSIIKRP